MTNAALVVGGLVALDGGAEVVVRAGTNLAGWLGIRPMVIGLTVVSLGTSMPELAVGIDAAVSGNPGIAVGNIVGTNLVNILFILGLSALLVPLALERATLRFDLPAMTAAALALYLLSLDGTLGRTDGVLLLLGGAAYTWGLLRRSRRETAGDMSQPSTHPREDRQKPLSNAIVLLAGLVAIVLGAELLVEGAVSSARSLGVSEAVIGLTIVAIGTSAPELVTTVLSTVRGSRGIAIGNLLGSSIYNIAVVLAVTVLASPRGGPVPDEVLAADLVLLVVVAAAAVPVVVSGARITRAEGGLFVVTYVLYLTWLLLTRT